jgi:hypothetical protein
MTAIVGFSLNVLGGGKMAAPLGLDVSSGLLSIADEVIK